jgi:hypothetical protein
MVPSGSPIPQAHLVCPTPGCPMVPIQEALRVVLPPPPTLSLALMLSPTWSPLPQQASAFCMPSPAPQAFQTRPRQLDLRNAPSLRVPSETSRQPEQPPLPPMVLPASCQSPTAPTPTLKLCLHSLLLVGLIMNVSCTRSPPPNLFVPPMHP